MNQVRTVSARTAGHLWDGLPDIDEKRVQSFAHRAVAETAPMRMVAVDLSSGMLAALIDDVALPDLAAVAATADPETWQQPFWATWHALSTGLSYQAALAAGKGRAETTGRDEVTRSERSTLTAVDNEESRLEGWRRVPSGKVCNWCATVAGQTYHSAESASFGHNNCSCTPVPIIGDRDPGRVLNRGLSNVGDSAYVDEHGHPVDRPDDTA